jgi:hypothetical protein
MSNSTMWSKPGFLNAVLPTYVLALAVLLSSAAFAQTQSGLGTIEGTVADATGAAIPRVSVQVLANATSILSSTKSSGVGFFQVPGLVAGSYVVTLSAPNMKNAVYQVELHAAQTAVLNPVMTVGSVTERVEVSASLVQLTTTDSGATSSVLENERINQLPMNGRAITKLTQLTTPGLENGFGPGTRANGLAGEAIEYVADGVPLLNRDFGGPNASWQMQYPDADSIQEVRIEVSGGGAQYSTPATGIITTKSGTNQLHGSLFWTGVNNTIVGVAKARQNPSNFVAPNFKRNEFGPSAGGPVVIPHLYNGKNKTFWFFGFERYSLVQTMNSLYSVDTPAMKRGDFSALANASGFIQLYDPATTHADAACPTPGVVGGRTIWNAGPPQNNPYCRTPFGNGILGDPGNNQIPLSRLNPVAKLMYDMTPDPNLPGVNPLIAPNYNWAGPNIYFVPTITWRIDHKFTDNDKAFMHFTWNRQFAQYPSTVPTTLAADGIPAMTSSTETIAPLAQFAAGISYTHIFSPTFFSETSISQSWFRDRGRNTGDIKTDFEKQLGLPNNFGGLGFPPISGFVMGHNGNQFGYGISQNIINLDENLTKTHGKHQLGFGGRFRHEGLGYQPDQSGDNDAAGGLSTALYDPSTGGNYGAYNNTGYAAADAFLGSFYNFSVAPLPPYTHYSTKEFDSYFQDNFHVSRSLTLNLGLRWEARPAMRTGGLGEGFDIQNKAIVMENPPSDQVSKGYTTQAIITNLQNLGVKFETPSQAGWGGLLKSYLWNFEPRVSFAWQPFGTRHGTVVRGGYGRYAFPEATRNMITGRNLPFFSGYSYNENSAQQSPDGLPNYQLRNPQNIFLGQNTANIINTASTNAILPGVGGSYLSHDFPPEQADETNLTIEQKFKDNSALRVTWNWTHASNLTRAFYPNAGLTPFLWEYTTGTLPPTGGASAIGTNQYAGTALNLYDNITYGNFGLLQRTGWSNDNSLQVNYQRVFSHGVAFQAMYVWSRPFRVGSNSTRDGLGYAVGTYLDPAKAAPGASFAALPGEGPITLPGAPPAPPAGTPSWSDYHALARFQDYRVDPYYSGLFHHFTMSFLVDLPIGRGKRLLSNANRFVDKLVGGWQIAGDGQVVSQNFSPASGNWGQVNPLVVYKHSVPITDCSSGSCFHRYMWFNGYISPKFLPPANGGVCSTNCVTGLPADYKPYLAPINNNPNIASNFGTNNVALTVPTLNNGQPITIAFAPDSNQNYAGNNPYSKTVLYGPFNYIADLSVFKVIPLKEKINLRINVDAFNAFNIMGYNNPNTTTGEQSVSAGGVDGSSYWQPRLLQFSIRLTF